MNEGSKDLRELIRILVRDLGILEKSDGSCCGVTITQCHAIVEIGRNIMIIYFPLFHKKKEIKYWNV